jgi:O-antigen ligase
MNLKMARIKVRHLLLSSMMIALLLVFSSSDWAAANVTAFDSSNSLGLQQRFQRLIDLSEAETTAEDTRRDLAVKTFNHAVQSPWHGYGLFLFHGDDYYPATISIFDEGSHNAYITVLGETGVFGLLVYVTTVIIGLRSVRKSNTTNLNKAVLYMMWMCYLVLGLFRHTQFTLLEAMVFAGFLYHLPHALSKSAAMANGGYQDFLQSRFRRIRQSYVSKAS